jgi:hypothetical protein
MHAVDVFADGSFWAAVGQGKHSAVDVFADGFFCPAVGQGRHNAVDVFADGFFSSSFLLRLGVRKQF